jgi:hypothetical protein
MDLQFVLLHQCDGPISYTELTLLLLEVNACPIRLNCEDMYLYGVRTQRVV